MLARFVHAITVLFTTTVMLALAVMLAGVTIAATPASAAPAHSTAPDIGVEFHGMWTAYTDDQRIRILDQLQNAGVTTVRMDVSWAMLQPDNGSSYDAWGTAFIDRIIALCNAHDITPLVTLWMTPAWANNGAGQHVLPNNVADYARVAQWVAARYTNKVAGWEVWNEQNSPAFLVGADPVAYTNLLKAAYKGFHAGYPGATVVFGGVEYNDDAWIARAYAAGAHGAFDVMATHPYMGMANQPPGLPDDGNKWMFTHAAAVHRLMVAHGDGDKSLWFTEFGWSTHANPPGTPNWDLGVTEAVQAQYFTQAVALIRATMPWVGKTYWYDDPDTTTNDFGQKANYGVLRLDLSPKPIMAAIAAATN